MRPSLAARAARGVILSSMFCLLEGLQGRWQGVILNPEVLLLRLCKLSD